MKLSPRSWVPWRPIGVVSYPDQNEASPPLRTANCETAATFVGSWEVSGVVPYANQNEASPSLRAADCENVATFVCCWEAMWSRVTRRPE